MSRFKGGKGIAAALVCALLLMQSSPSAARETLRWPDGYIPTSDAIAQSNAFAIGVEMSEKLKDGWQHQGFKTILDRNGNFDPSFSSSLVVDRLNDPILRDTVAQARKRFGNLPDREKAEALTNFARARFSPKGMSDDALSDWDDSFGNRHQGERILLGEYILQGKGVCEEEAVLLKVLSDELNLPCTLIFGFDGNIGHVWTTIKIDGRQLIYDPTQEIIAGNIDQIEGHESIRSIYGRDFDKLQAVIEAHDELERKDYASSENDLKSIAALDLKALGAKHPVYAVSLERLSDFYKDREQFDKAEPLLRQALAVCVAARGRHHQEVAACLNDLANLEHRLGRNREAIKMYKQSISTYAGTLGRNDASVADPSYNLACLLEEEGKYSQSERLFKRALSIYRKTKGPDHSDTNDAIEKLSALRRLQTAGRSDGQARP